MNSGWVDSWKSVFVVVFSLWDYFFWVWKLSIAPWLTSVVVTQFLAVLTMDTVAGISIAEGEKAESLFRLPDQSLCSQLPLVEWDRPKKVSLLDGTAFKRLLRTHRQFPYSRTAYVPSRCRMVCHPRSCDPLKWKAWLTHEGRVTHRGVRGRTWYKKKKLIEK